MDFIEQLPGSDRFSTILVIVDRLMKQVIFVPTYDTVDAPGVAWLFLNHVFSKHGILAHVTSDRGSEFVSHFFRSLGKLLQMHLHFTSGYHLEGNGQTEWANQVLEQYLQIYMNYQQDNWTEFLPLTEFAYNNATNATTGVSPFFTNKGYHLEITADLQAVSTSTEVEQFMTNLSELQDALKENIAKAQEHYQKNADCNRVEAPDMKLGDLVYVKARYFQMSRPSKKLSEKNLGPFEIIGRLGSHSFTIPLPQQFQTVHPVFHVSQLEPAKPDPFPHRRQPPWPQSR